MKKRNDHAEPTKVKRLFFIFIYFCLLLTGNSRSLSLDVYDQFDNLEKTNQFRFTPPTHTMLAFSQAIAEFEKEGGVKGRGARYSISLFLLPVVPLFNTQH